MIIIVIEIITGLPDGNLQIVRSLNQWILPLASQNTPLAAAATPFSSAQPSSNLLFSSVDTIVPGSINNNMPTNNSSAFSNLIANNNDNNETSPAKAIYFRVWNDPNENAFSMLLPQGWSAIGGTLRNIAGTGDPDFQVNATDPTGREQILFAFSYKYYISPLLIGLPEGSIYNPTMTIPNPPTPNVYSYRSAADYVNQFIVPELQKEGYQDVQILKMTDYPVPSYYYSPETTQVTAISTILSFNKGGEEYLGGLRLLTSSVGLVWFVDYQGVISPKNDFQKVSNLASMILPTTRINLQWAQNEVIQKQIRSGIRIDLQKYLENSIDQRFVTRESTTDITSQAWSEAMLGTTQAEDPDTGTTYTVPNNFPYWWVDPHGNLVGTTTNENPNVDQGFKVLKLKNSDDGE